MKDPKADFPFLIQGNFRMADHPRTGFVPDYEGSTSAFHHSPDTTRQESSLTNQTTSCSLAHMLDSRIRRLLDAYPAIFLACHRKHLREDESGNKITEHQASVLDHLHATRPTTLSRLAEHMGVSRSTMSITVFRLIRGGYIARRHDTKDRRSVGLTLTAAGARIKEQNTLLDPDLVQKMFGFMSAAELEVALRGLERLAVSAGALLRRRSRGGA